MPDQSQAYRRHLHTLRRDLPPTRPPRLPLRGPRLRIPWYIATGIALLAAGALYLRLWPNLPPATVNLAVRTLEVSLDEEALVVHGERVYTSPVAGQARRLVPEGQRVRVGTPVAEVAPNGGAAPTTVFAETAGMLTFQVDGLEAALDPAQAVAWKPAWFKSLAAPNPRRLAEGRVESGGALFKIVDNVAQTLILVAEEGTLPIIDAGMTMQVRFAGRGAPVEATLTRLERESGTALLHLTPQRLPQDLNAVRRAKITLIFATYFGKVVPRTAIDVRDGRQGVWALEDNEPVFTPARVLGGNVQDVVLETDLPPGSRILRQAPVRM